jgi:uncharacterized membrane protein
MLKNRTIISYSLIIVSTIMNIAFYFYLPNQLVMQYLFDGRPGLVIESWLGLLLMTGLTVFFCLRLSHSETKIEWLKWFFPVAIVFFFNIITILLNSR